MPACLRPCDVFARTYTHAQGWTAVCMCVCACVVGEVGGRSNRSRTRTIPTTRTRTEPNRTAPHRTTLSPFRRSDTRQTVANRLTSKRVLGVVCSPNNSKNSSYDCETHTHTHTLIRVQAQAQARKHTHTQLSDMCTLIWIWWEISISRD